MVIKYGMVPPTRNGCNFNSCICPLCACVGRKDRDEAKCGKNEVVVSAVPSVSVFVALFVEVANQVLPHDLPADILALCEADAELVHLLQADDERLYTYEKKPRSKTRAHMDQGSKASTSNDRSLFHWYHSIREGATCPILQVADDSPH